MKYALSLPQNSLVVFTDGSTRNELSGSGAIIFSNGKTLKEISIPVGNKTISYAELYAIYAVLRWIRHDYVSTESLHSLDKIPIHIFTDSKYAFNILCKKFLPKKNFLLIEEIKNTYSFLQANFDIAIHWIPSHTEKTSIGIRPIKGNERADELAEAAQRRSSLDLYDNDINMIRKAIMRQSANLISNIDKLLKSSSGINPIDHTDGPSTSVDDFSSADAIRNVSEDIP